MGLFGKSKKHQIQQLNNNPVKVKGQKRPLLGIAFGGGGTRGFAHLGVIRAFEEHGIDFDFVSGTSVGSIIGALYCYGLDYKQMYRATQNLKVSDIKNSKVFFIPSKSANIENMLRGIIGDVVFSDLKKPFAVATVDLISGNEVVITSGLVARATSASSAVPGVFTPVEWQNYRLVDGGLTNPVPATLVRNLGADIVVSVDINKTRGYGTTSTTTSSVLLAALRIAMKGSAEKGLSKSDIVIQPYLKEYSPTKLEGVAEMMKAGYEEALKHIGEIKKLIATYGDGK